jgi:hypothetical protein
MKASVVTEKIGGDRVDREHDVGGLHDEQHQEERRRERLPLATDEEVGLLVVARDGTIFDTSRTNGFFSGWSSRSFSTAS